MHPIKIVFFDIDGTLIDMQTKRITPATLDTLRAMFPAARVHESAKKAGVSSVFLTVTKPEKPHNTKQNG